MTAAPAPMKIISIFFPKKKIGTRGPPTYFNDSLKSRFLPSSSLTVNFYYPRAFTGSVHQPRIADFESEFRQNCSKRVETWCGTGHNPWSKNSQQVLMTDLFQGYEKMMLPVSKAKYPNQVIDIEVDLFWTQLLDIDEKAETLTVSVMRKLCFGRKIITKLTGPSQQEKKVDIKITYIMY